MMQSPLTPPLPPSTLSFLLLFTQLLSNSGLFLLTGSPSALHKKNIKNYFDFFQLNPELSTHIAPERLGDVRLLSFRTDVWSKARVSSEELKQMSL